MKRNPSKNKLNTRNDKLHFAFRMYDLNGNDYISKEELLAVLTMMVGANIKTEQLLSIAERTIMEADTDHDNLISFEEFAKVNYICNKLKTSLAKNRDALRDLGLNHLSAVC